MPDTHQRIVKGICVAFIAYYTYILPLVSLPIVCHLQKIGVNRSWPFAMGFKGLFRTGHILNS